MCAMPYGRFKTKVRRHDRLFAGSAGCSEILKARALRVLLGAPSGIGLRGDMVVQIDFFSLSNQDFAFRVI